MVVVWMEYIQRIKQDFLDKSIFQAWEIIRMRMHGKQRTLVHPCNMKKELLAELIPKKFNINEILQLIPAKQKEIARRLDISALPSSRPSGMLGQTALFEILRNKGFDFKSYVDGFRQNWDQSHVEGYVLLFTLGHLHYLRRFFEYPPVDLVKSLLEPITRYQLAITWDENWVTRILTNIFSVSPANMSNEHIRQVVRNLMGVQDAWGMTVHRVMEWTGESRTSASHLMDIMRASWLEHRFRIVGKNTGTVKILSKSQATSKMLPSFHSSGTSFTDDSEHFISLFDVFRKDAEGKFFELEAMTTNVDLYDPKDQTWKLNPSPKATRTKSDIYSLLQVGNHTVPDNDILPTNRDLLIIALLTAMDTGHHPNKKQEILQTITKGYGVPHEEAANGIRNVLRKNMVRNQYTHVSMMEDREAFTVIFDDQPKKVIPFLGEVLQNFAFFSFQINYEMSYGHIFDLHPSYLSCDLRMLIESSMRQHGINGELLALHSYLFGQPGSILQLIPDE
ncbi:MAG: hypothetical protein EAX95_16510 [Candidatus Thorarchaeota archaeon]|nr:hypothetical protein [Candidatus Thorarchaeota archaeon]